MRFRRVGEVVSYSPDFADSSFRFESVVDTVLQRQTEHVICVKAFVLWCYSRVGGKGEGGVGFQARSSNVCGGEPKAVTL